MDLYISDSMQDMLDIDIKSEVATVVGGVNEFSSLMNNELPSLEIGCDSNSNDCDTSAWLGGPKWSAVNTDIYADVGACVNPNSVMPVISSSSVNNTTNSAVASVASLLKSPKNQLDLNTNVMGSDVQMPSPRERKSHLTFSPNMIKIPMVKDAPPKPSSLARTNNGIDSVRKDLNDDLKDIKYVQKPQKILSNSQLINDRGGSPSLVRTNGSNTIKLAGGIGGLTFANSMQFNKLKQSIQQKALNQNGSFKRDRSSSPSPAQFQHNNGTSQHMNGTSNSHTMNGANSPKMFSRINGNGNANNSQQTKLKQKPTGHEFPKPAYSYSCLIAMALKNSRSGSLPVSEIYSFMCEHFPYFKTAPNGWKNSVRHNLSLNKCFEKIEKPATNGGQRKGCLWAMNPSKIAKMDEEVQKWSRKDPMAIRKAMVFPEHLESLERGEMKHGSTGESDNENEGEENEEEQSDAEEIDNEVDETFINTPPESCEDEEPDVDFDVEVSSVNKNFPKNKSYFSQKKNPLENFR